MAMYRYFSSVDKLPNYQILLAPCLQKYCSPPLFWLMQSVVKSGKGAMSSCRPMSMMVHNIGLSLTWLLLTNGCIPGIFIYPCTITSMLNSLTHNCTFMCDVSVVSIIQYGCGFAIIEPKTFLWNLCQRPIYENFVPRKFLAIRIFRISSAHYKAIFNFNNQLKLACILACTHTHTHTHTPGWSNGWWQP